MNFVVINAQEIHLLIPIPEVFFRASIDIFVAIFVTACLTYLAFFDLRAVPIYTAPVIVGLQQQEVEQEELRVVEGKGADYYYACKLLIKGIASCAPDQIVVQMLYRLNLILQSGGH